MTPPDVAVRMVEYLGPVGDFLTLEPQAGTGNLLKALYDSGHSRYELAAIERDVRLCAAIRQRFSGQQYIDPINSCFLDYAKEAIGNIEFPRIIMNPPFSFAKKHINAALALLGRSGHSVATMVALVPINLNIDGAKTMMNLPRDTFDSVTVSSKIIRLRV